ncbi:MAG: hypothetical protein ABI432_13835, partial [Flavobacteriales bacterium]
QLAPDGKIYISTGNGTQHLHVIHTPDEPGLACNMEQHGIALPRYFSNSLPNHPNYHLGPVDGSVCDSLGINTGLDEEQQSIELKAFPNPSDGRFTLSWAGGSCCVSGYHRGARCIRWICMASRPDSTNAG